MTRVARDAAGAFHARRRRGKAAHVRVAPNSDDPRRSVCGARHGGVPGHLG
jgi:hypothetical protein